MNWNLKRIVLGFGLSLMGSLHLFGQTPAQEIEKLRDVYSASQNLSMDLKYEVFEQGTAKSVDVTQGSFVSDGKSSISVMGPLTILQGQHFSLVCDDEMKVIVVQDPQLHIQAKRRKRALPGGLDSLFTQGSKIELIKSNDQHATIHVIIEDDAYASEFSDIFISYSSTDYLIGEVTIVYRTELDMDEDTYGKETILPKLVISYDNVKIGEELTSSDFSLDRFFTTSNQGYQGVGKYANYQILDQRNATATN